MTLPQRPAHPARWPERPHRPERPSARRRWQPAAGHHQHPPPSATSRPSSTPSSPGPGRAGRLGPGRSGARSTPAAAPPATTARTAPSPSPAQPQPRRRAPATPRLNEVRVRSSSVGPAALDLQDQLRRRRHLGEGSSPPPASPPGPPRPASPSPSPTPGPTSPATSTPGPPPGPPATAPTSTPPSMRCASPYYLEGVWIAGHRGRRHDADQGHQLGRPGDRGGGQAHRLGDGLSPLPGGADGACQRQRPWAVSGVSNFVHARVVGCAGDVEMRSQANKRQIRRNCMLHVAARARKVDLQRSLPPCDGTLPGIVSLYRDERVTPALGPCASPCCGPSIAPPGLLRRPGPHLRRARQRLQDARAAPRHRSRLHDHPGRLLALPLGGHR